MTDIEQILKHFQPEVETIRKDLAALRTQVTSDEAVGAFFLSKVEQGLECAIGCVVLAKAGTALPMAIVARSMLESLMTTFWAATSPDRGQEAAAAEVNEGMRLMRNWLTNGHGKIVNKRTGEDLTQTFLGEDRLKNAKAPRQIKVKAQESGLGPLYDRLYGMMSMPTHGNAIGLTGGQGGDEAILTQLVSIRICLKGIHLVANNWIRNHVPTSLEQLDQVLKIGLTRKTSDLR